MGILDILSGPGAQPAAVRRPSFAVHFGGGGGGGGGLLEAAGSALGLTPAGEDPWAAALISIRIDACLAPGVDQAVLHVANEARAPTVALGDEGSIELGYGKDENVVVFTGVVDSITSTLAGPTRITLVNGGATLARTHLDRSYQGQSAGAIVKDLLGQCGVDAGTVEDGSDYSFFVVDGVRTVYQHIARLALRSGFVAAMTAANGLNFAPGANGSPVQSFAYGQDLVAARLVEGAPPSGVTFTGEGAAGSQGDDAWAFLVKDPAPVQKSSGSPDGAALLADPSLRSGAAVETAAKAWLAGNSAGVGRLLTAGAAAVVPGAAIEIAGAPTAALNGLHLVTRVRHSYDKARGFATEITFRPAGQSGGGLPALPAGLL